MIVSNEVDAWFDEYENPQKPAMQAVREVIMSDERMSETIKWKSPTFMFQGNLASFNPRSKAHVSLLFHSGASIPDISITSAACPWRTTRPRGLPRPESDQLQYRGVRPDHRQPVLHGR